MRRDSTVCIMGEDVAEAGTPFKVLSGLLEEFGKERVLDTPISEAGFTGLAVGAAMTGMRPVVDIMFGDFHHPDHGPDGQSGRESPLHVGRKVESADGDAHHHGSHSPFRSATLAIAACLVLPRSRIESGSAVDAIRRQRTAEGRDS